MSLLGFATCHDSLVKANRWTELVASGRLSYADLRVMSIGHYFKIFDEIAKIAKAEERQIEKMRSDIPDLLKRMKKR